MSHTSRTGPRHAAVLTLGGALVSLAVAVLLYTRFSVYGDLSRDEAIYAYGGQQLARGVAPYVSIFDPKTPLATVVAGVAATLARVTGRGDLTAIRLAFFTCACLSVVATYLLGTRLWRSRLAGLACAVVFASFRGFALDALPGPDAKTPGVLLAIVSMLLLTRRRWFWAAASGSLAFLVWQPFGLYSAVVVVASVAAAATGERWRALTQAVLGAVTPVLLTAVCFAVAGALGSFVESALVFPVAGIHRSPETVPERLRHIVSVVDLYYRFSGALFWVGLVLLVVLALVHLVRVGPRRAVRHPLVWVVLPTLLGQALYASTDFQSYPDVFPLLVYGALGIGGGVAALAGWRTGEVARVVVTAVVVVALVALTAYSTVSFHRDVGNDEALLGQRVDACALDTMVPRHRALYAVGDPTTLVLTHRRNPDRYIYLGSGVIGWKLAHLRGGLRAWLAQVEATRPAVVVTNSLSAHYRVAMGTVLRGEGYRHGYLGPWRMFVDPAAARRAQRSGIALSPAPEKVVRDLQGRRWRATRCAVAGHRLPGCRPC
jgi:hypothetical protein